MTVITGTTAPNAASNPQGDWDVRGADWETILVGPISESIIDADRLVRIEHRNGFPNWALYRTALAGDSIYLPSLRRWVVAFTVAYCMDGGVKRNVYSDDLACVAAWDALHILIYRKPLEPYYALADALGVHHKTYLRLRNAIARRLEVALGEYWIRMQSAIRQVARWERQNNFLNGSAETRKRI